MEIWLSRKKEGALLRPFSKGSIQWPVCGYSNSSPSCYWALPPGFLGLTSKSESFWFFEIKVGVTCSLSLSVGEPTSDSIFKVIFPNNTSHPCWNPSFSRRILSSSPQRQGSRPHRHSHFYLPLLPHAHPSQTDTLPSSNSSPWTLPPKLGVGTLFSSFTCWLKSLPQRNLSCSLYGNLSQPSHCPGFLYSQLLWQLYFSCLSV